jgi:hypothetical protein
VRSECRRLPQVSEIRSGEVVFTDTRQPPGEKGCCMIECHGSGAARLLIGMKPMTVSKLAAGIAGTTGAGGIGVLTGASARIATAHAGPAAMSAVMAAVIALPAVVASLALILAYRQKKLEIESAARLEKTRQEMYRVLLEKSAADPACAASYRELIDADAKHLSVERNGAQPASRPYGHLNGRGSPEGADR